MLKILQQRTAHLLSERQLRMAPSFAAEMNVRLSPVYVGQLELNDVPCPESEAREKKQNCSVTPTGGWFRIAWGNESFYFIFGQIAWKRVKAPVCQNRDRGIQADTAFAFRDQKPKEHTQSRRAGFGCGPTVLSVGLHSKVAQIGRVKLPRLCSEAVKQPADMDAISAESTLAGASQLAHPFTEVQEQDRVLRICNIIMEADDTHILQVSEKKTSAMELISICVAKVRACVTVQVATKPLNRLFGQIG
jgi:hypothetical protein